MMGAISTSAEVVSDYSRWAAQSTDIAARYAIPRDLIAST
jgi:hypothetical protein